MKSGQMPDISACFIWVSHTTKILFQLLLKISLLIKRQKIHVFMRIHNYIGTKLAICGKPGTVEAKIKARQLLVFENNYSRRLLVVAAR